MQWLHRYAQGLMASQGDRRAGIRQKTLDQTASTGRQSDHTSEHGSAPVSEVPIADGPGAKPC